MDDDSASLSTAFGRPHAEFDALLINAEIYRTYGKAGKIVLNKKGWEAFISDLPTPLAHGTIKRLLFVTNGVNPEYDVPAKQTKANVRLQGTTTLPANILQRLKESADHFDAKNAEWAAAAKALGEEAAKKKAEERARKEAQTAKAIRYPILSNVVGHDEAISLDNPKVKEWSSSVLTEAFQLHTDQGSEISIQASNGQEYSLLHIPRSSDIESFIVSDCQTGWIERSVEMSINKCMSATEAIQGMRRRLDVLEKKLRLTEKSLSETQEVSSDSDGGDNEADANVRMNKIYHMLYHMLCRLIIKWFNTTSQAPQPKRCKKEVRSTVVKLLAPQISKELNEDGKINWSSEKPVGRTTLHHDTKDLQSVLMAVSRANPARAGNAISQLLSDKANERVRDIVKEQLLPFKGPDVGKIIVIDGIRDSVSHHSRGKGGSRTKPEETFVKSVALASVFAAVKSGVEVSDSALSKALGITRHQLSLARDRAEILISEDTGVTDLKRKIRCDFIQEKLERFTYEFLIDDLFSRLDTNQKKVDLVHPGTGLKISEHKRIWRIVNKEQQYLLFVCSEHHTNFQKYNRDRSGVAGFSTAGNEEWQAKLTEGVAPGGHVRAGAHRPFPQAPANLHPALPGDLLDQVAPEDRSFQASSRHHAHFH